MGEHNIHAVRCCRSATDSSLSGVTIARKMNRGGSIWTFLPECSLPARRATCSPSGAQATVLTLDIGDDAPRVPDRTPDMHEMNIKKRGVIHSAETADRTGDSQVRLNCVLGQLYA
ncbi:hypothetical protein [Dactylosporangium sp. CA-092794]|uniref:hypothetical protein n=1 Tax=Dactylosporangium sp. CA-092794 TaxID=3239929 RepID=UPI003D904404